MGGRGSLAFKVHDTKREKKENYNVGNRHAYGKGILPGCQGLILASMRLTYKLISQSGKRLI